MTDSELRTKNPFATISLEKLIGAAMDNVPFDCADFYEHRFELSRIIVWQHKVPYAGISGRGRG